MHEKSLNRRSADFCFGRILDDTREQLDKATRLVFLHGLQPAKRT